MRLLLLITCCAALAACTSTLTKHDDQAKAAQSGVNVVDYQCQNGESVRVSYFIDQDKALLERNGDAIELQQRPSGSGMIYSNGPNTIRGKGKELSLEIGRMLPIECVQK
ncbi:MliC family protein [Lampropedia aestuarii]|uniref:MliC family protein n=1 Tax=Lampropedia aestuarii TaxID=2562762 RepID=UPI00246924C4|nr:MliC family protein [Lampropedia aestuarii]MDH5858597.1 MliC family protein [Lampropedia aestuarii]